MVETATISFWPSRGGSPVEFLGAARTTLHGLRGPGRFVIAAPEFAPAVSEEVEAKFGTCASVEIPLRPGRRVVVAVMEEGGKFAPDPDVSVGCALPVGEVYMGYSIVPAGSRVASGEAPRFEGAATGTVVFNNLPEDVPVLVVAKGKDGLTYGSAWCHVGEQKVTIELAPLVLRTLAIELDEAVHLVESALVLVESIDGLMPPVQELVAREAGGAAYVCSVEVALLPGATRTLRFSAPGHADAVVQIDPGRRSSAVVLRGLPPAESVVNVTLGEPSAAEHVIGLYECGGLMRVVYGRVRRGRTVLRAPAGAVLRAVRPVGGPPWMLEYVLPSPVEFQRTPSEVAIVFPRGGWISVGLEADITSVWVTVDGQIIASLGVESGTPEASSHTWRSEVIPAGKVKIVARRRSGLVIEREATVHAGQITSVQL